ncbi:hypothetical protein, partial [Mesorhizobium sp. M2E.F.Ca.ET.209.01.1.1]|uniref:hypothetical protein n=1 Tax=Mesorhizobium sp. M2E.F.Ca.ET.209.01.1.1 TaxID=2500526 RepID=UPI001AEEBB27
SASGVASYAGLLASADLTLTGQITATGNSKSVNTYYLVDTTVNPATVVGTFSLPSAQNGLVFNFAATITIPNTTDTYVVYNANFGTVGTLTPGPGTPPSTYDFTTGADN